MASSPKTQTYFNEALKYEPETGLMFWRERPRHHFKTDSSWKNTNAKMAGKVAGYSNDEGYVKVGIDGKSLSVHRVALFMETGVWPDKVDHIDGDTSNNALLNLRSGDHSLNMKNRKLSATNKSGHLGVVWEKAKGLWAARIPVNGKLKTLGRSKDIEKVIALRKQAEIELGYHKNHGRVQDGQFA